jgi:uroporphyrinogen decarboxylase
MMSPRERLLTVLAGEIPDRVPVAPFLQQEFLSEYFHRGDTDRLIDACICADELGFDLITKENSSTRPYFLEKSYPDWEVGEQQVTRDGMHYKITTVTTPKKTFTKIDGAPVQRQIQAGIHYAATQFMIESHEDLEIFLRYLPKGDDAHRQAICERGKFARSYIGERGINAPWTCGGVFNLACEFISMQQMITDAMIDHDFFDAYMTMFSDVLTFDAECFAISEYDVAGMQGNMANGGLLREQHFLDYILPYEKRAYQPLIDAGKPVLYHNCGSAAALLPCYRDLGITIYETLAAPPEGDTILSEAKELFSDTPIVLCGTFDQVNFLKSGSPEAIFEAAASIVRTGKEGGRYIFAASDYIELGTPLENMKSMLAGAQSQAAYEL